MLNNEWKLVTGVNTTDDDNNGVAARKTSDGCVAIAYPAYGGLKTVVLSGIRDLATDEEVSTDVFDSQMAIVRQTAGDDWEVMVFPLVNGVVWSAYVDDCNVVTVLDNNGTQFSGDVDVDESNEFSADEFVDVDEDLLRLFGYMAE